jgi:hypothetical protein
MVGRHVCYLESEDGEKTLVLGNYSVGEKVTLGGNEKNLSKSFIAWRSAVTEDEWKEQKSNFPHGEDGIENLSKPM